MPAENDDEQEMVEVDGFPKTIATFWKSFSLALVASAIGVGISSIFIATVVYTLQSDLLGYLQWAVISWTIGYAAFVTDFALRTDIDLAEIVKESKESSVLPTSRLGRLALVAVFNNIIIGITMAFVFVADIYLSSPALAFMIAVLYPIIDAELGLWKVSPGSAIQGGLMIGLHKLGLFKEYSVRNSFKQLFPGSPQPHPRPPRRRSQV